VSSLPADDLDLLAEVRSRNVTSAEPARGTGHYCVAREEGATRCGFCGVPVTPIPPLQISWKDT